jgi:hypothetical protein
MDPFLENVHRWPDVHHNLISEVQAVLNRLFRPRYYVRVELRMYVSDEDEEIQEAYIEVKEVLTRDTVTVLEIASPTNKVPGSRARASYLK